MARFEAKKDTLTYSVFLGLPLLLLITYFFSLKRALTAEVWSVGKVAGFALIGLFVLTLAYTLYRFFRDTHYEINDQSLVWVMGFFSRSISLDRIQWIEESTYINSNVRAALAWKGWKIGYGAGYEIFVSPEEAEAFKRVLEEKMAAVKDAD